MAPRPNRPQQEGQQEAASPPSQSPPKTELPTTPPPGPSGPSFVPVEAPEPELPMPTHVVGAIARVMAEIGGIRKMSSKERVRLGLIEDPGDKGVKYAYRGIDQLAAAAQPLFGKYGVVIIPTVLTQQIEPVIVNNNPWTDTFVEVRWDIYGPAGRDDMIVSTTTGIGRDNSDKGVNKAMTTAFKNLLLRILCVGDPQDDADSERHETGTRDENRREAADDAKSPADAVFEAIRDGSARVKAAVKALSVEHEKPASANAMHADPEWRALVAERIEATKIAEQQDAVAEAHAADHGTVEPSEDLPAEQMVCLECGLTGFSDAMAYEDHVAEHGTSA